MGIGKFLNKTAGMLAGAAGAKTGLYSQIENIAEKSTAKALGRSFLHGSASSNVPLGAVALADSVVKPTTSANSFLGYKLSGVGKTVVGGAIGYSVVRDLYANQQKLNMGQISSTVQAPPSMMTDYDGITSKNLSDIDSGADGNLVFALNKLR